MKKSKKIWNYITMACSVISAIIFFIDQNWYAALWSILALIWIVNSHLAEDSYYDCKESLDKLTYDYISSLVNHTKEVKELKNEIKKLSKEE